jgi:hypothetical protein
MLKPNTAEPDWIVVRRFENLCKFLDEHRAMLPVVSYTQPRPAEVPLQKLPKVTLISTLSRYTEQFARRLI